MSKINSITAMKDEIAACRRELHQNPQTAYEEIFASELVQKKLTEWGIPFKTGFAQTGLVATIEGQKTDSGKAIGLRADMDALSMTEQSGQPWASKIPGKMHGCGHDGHTAMLLGAAKYLAATRNFNGKVHLIFQPAEEGGGGAIRMIEDGLFKHFPMNAVFGMHNWPAMKRGTIGLRPGPIMASSDSFDITVTGKGGHAALPHFNTDPIVAASHIVTALQTLVARQIDPVDQAVLSITNFNAGTGAFNVIPDQAVLSGTYRAFRVETRAYIEKRLREIPAAIASAFGCACELRVNDGYDPTINSAAESAFCADIARQLVGEENVNDAVEPCMGAEDFGAMLQQVPGCYIWMGQGEPDAPESPHNKGLHNAGYDFNDAILPLGIEYWARLAEAALKLEE
ncbi:MAG: M20 aminoacylase family protein [Micavibrio sp.]